MVEAEMPVVYGQVVRGSLAFMCGLESWERWFVVSDNGLGCMGDWSAAVLSCVLDFV